MDIREMNPFTSTFTVLYSMDGYDNNEWTFATYRN